MDTTRITRLVRIHGRVQRVGFRHAMAGEARRLALTGWVRNRSDGTVEAMLSGDPEAVAALLDWAGHGPPGAAVEHVLVEDAAGSWDRFEAVPTA